MKFSGLWVFIDSWEGSPLWGLLLGLLLTSLLAIFSRPSAALGDELRPLYRGARAQAMGNAFTAVADDEEALFFNPAGLAGIKNFSFTLASVNLEASSYLIQNYSTLESTLSSPSVSSISSLIGKDLYARAQGTAAITVPGFGIAAIYDAQGVLRLRNLAFPTGIYGSQVTDGIQAGFGTAIWKLKRKKGELRVGAALKVLWRSGAFQSPSLTELMTLDSSSIKNLLNNTGIGYGADLGTQFIYNLRKNWIFSAGLSWTDLGTTSFAGGAPPLASNLTGGLAMKYKVGDLNATLAYDYAHIFDTLDWAKKNHLGLELKFPILSLSVGMNQLSVSYGLSLDLWVVRLAYVGYSEDQLTLANQDSEQRSMVSATFKLEL